MGKVVYNTCYGGFSLSYEAVMRYAELKGIKIYAFAGYKEPYTAITSNEEASKQFCVHYTTSADPTQMNEYYFSTRDIPRHDPILVQVVEELGSKRASGSYARLCVEEIPSGCAYRIDEYDGNESVETHDTYDWIIMP